ncbi:MAG: TadE family protein [Candidatus Diapherotrites archaeon]
MGNRGQASIEFIFVLLFMLVIVMGIIVPLGQKLQHSLDDVGRAGSVAKGVSQFDSAFRMMVGSNSDSRQIVSVFLPKGSTFVCDPVKNDVNITLPLHLNVFNSDGSVPSSCIQLLGSGDFLMECSKKITLPPNTDLHCGGSGIDDYAIETGAVGFAQSFRIGVKYTSTMFPPYVIDVNTG